MREVALIAQSVRKLPETRRRPQTLMNTKFQILDEDLKSFMTDLAGCERVNTLYELVSMVSNYCEKFNLWVEHNEEAVMCDRTLTKALGFAGFLWSDLAQMLLDKAKICPATEAQRIESSLRFPNPPITSIPGAKCSNRKTILDTEIDLGKEYVIPSGFRLIFAKIRQRLSQRERNMSPIKMRMARLEQLILYFIRTEIRSVPGNESFYIIKNTGLGRVMQLDALDRKQCDVVLAPLLIGEEETDDEDLADDEIVEKIRQLDERKRTLNERRAQLQAGQAEVIDLVEVVDGGQGDQEEDEEDGELAEQNQDAGADN